MIREIVSIDEDLCNGCGECVPACAEGAIQIIDGKARLIADTLCDGLGACLGHCPQGAIKIERREAAEFDEAATQRHVAGLNASVESRPSDTKPAAAPGTGESTGHAHSSCPSSRFTQFDRSPHRSDAHTGSDCETQGVSQASELAHWPVQLRLLPPTAPVLRGARLLVAADCVPVAYAGFHSEFLRDHAIVIACPKLDDPSGYLEKLTEMIRRNDLAEITVAHMEVPCCGGILHMVLQARELAGNDVPVNDVSISIRGEVLTRRQVPIQSKASGDCGSACCPNTGVK
jgi:NAD-dependent dihydropyrimidine dehydrogenase PreA subunit